MRSAVHLAFMMGLACSAAGCFIARSGETDRRVELPPLPDSVWAAAAESGAGAPGRGAGGAAPPAGGSATGDEPGAGGLAALHARTLAAFADDGWQFKGDRLFERRLSHCRLTETGLLRIVEERGMIRVLVAEMFDAADLREIVVGFTPNGAFLTERELARQRRHKEIDERVAAEERPGHDGDDGEDEEAPDLWLGEGVSIGFPLEVDADTKGVIIHLPALMGTKYERRAVQRLRALGWTLLHVRGPTDIAGPNDAARHEASRRRAARAGQRRDLIRRERPEASPDMEADGEAPPSVAQRREIAQTVRAEIPMPPTGLEAQPGEPSHAVARRIAQAADTGFAETALAAEAALDTLMEVNPHLRDRPVVVTGFSAGAIAAPAVAVRLGERIDAVVLIGGGADGLTVSQTSSVTRGGVKLGLPDGPEPAPEFVQRVRADYRELSQLDPYNTAPRLGNLPVLQVMARGDEMVPTAHQWTLWERLGRPDRITWHGPLGHKGLFYFLPGQMGRIDAWITRQVGGGVGRRE